MDENNNPTSSGQNPNQPGQGAADTGGQAPGTPSEQPPAPAGGVCKTCGKTTSGYKCDMCGAETADHDPNHACGGEHCVAKCSDCGQAENRCTCPPQATGAGGVDTGQPAPSAPAV